MGRAAIIKAIIRDIKGHQQGTCAALLSGAESPLALHSNIGPKLVQSETGTLGVPS